MSTRRPILLPPETPGQGLDREVLNHILYQLWKAVGELENRVKELEKRWAGVRSNSSDAR
jgi:hypothetical protein